MANFKRIAEIDVRVSVEGAMRKLTRLTNHQKRLLNQELDLLEKKRKRGGLSEQESLRTRKRIAAIKIKLAGDEYKAEAANLRKIEIANAQHAKKVEALNKALKKALSADSKYHSRVEIERLRNRIKVQEGLEKAAAARHAANQKYQESLDLQRLRERLAIQDGMEKAAAQRRARILRHIENLERQHARRVENINRKKNARIASSDGRRSGGLSPVGGIGMGGGFGYMMGGGLAGGAIIGGLALAGGARRAGTEFLEQEMAVARMMSLVSEQEQKAGFTLQFAREEAQRLAIALGMEIPEAAIAMREAITTAVDPLRAGDFLRAAHGLALSEGVAPEQVTAALASVRKAYEMTTAQMAELPDIVFTSIDEGRLKLGQISNQLGDVAGVMRAAGVSFKELMAAAAALTRGGMNPARAMTSLRAFGEILQKPATQKVREARDAAGLDMSPERMRAVGFVQMMDDIRSASERTGATIAELLGGKARALKGVIQLTGALRDDMVQILEAQTENIGRSAREHEKLMQSAPMKFKRVQAQISASMADVGGQLVQWLTDAAGEGKDFEKTLSNIDDIFETVVGTVGILKDTIDVLTLPAWLGREGGKYLAEQLGIWEAIHQVTAAEEIQAERINALKKEDLDTLQKFKEAQEERNALEERYARQVDAVHERLKGLKDKLLQQEISANESMLDDFKSSFNERLSFLKSKQSEELSQAKQHANSLKALEKKRVDYMISQTSRLEQQRMEQTGAGDMERAIRAKQRFEQFSGLAQQAAGKGKTDEAMRYNAQAQEQAQIISGLDLSGVARFGPKFDEAVQGLAGSEIARILADQQAKDRAEGKQPRRRASSLDRFRATDRARAKVRAFADEIRDRRRSFVGGDLSFEQTFAEDLQRQVSAQGLGILDMGARRERSAGAKHLEQYKLLTQELNRAKTLWTEIRQAAEAAAKATQEMAANFSSNPLAMREQMLRRRKSLTQRMDSFVGSLGERFRTPDSATPSEVAEVAKVVYDQPITVTQHFHGPADANTVEDASLQGIREGLERGTGTLNNPK